MGKELDDDDALEQIFTSESAPRVALGVVTPKGGVLIENRTSGAIEINNKNGHIIDSSHWEPEADFEEDDEIDYASDCDFDMK